MFRSLALISTFCFLFAINANAVPAAPPQDEQEFQKWARDTWDNLDRKKGKISLPNGVATLDVPEHFYYLSPRDANKVLVDVWGNPPGQNTLGMLLPDGVTPFDQDSWGVTINYVAEGYVKDDDADDINYDDLLADMKNDVEEENKQRRKMGYETVELIGWAAKPYYDKASHKLHWAKEIKFGTQQVNTLNYNIRVLGRKGVLVLNFIAGMDQKQMIDSRVNDVLAIAEFNSGYKYSEFNPSIDTVAAYGIGGLVAGKVLAKAGFFAVILLFLKKFWIFIVLGFGILFSRLFKRS